MTKREVNSGRTVSSLLTKLGLAVSIGGACRGVQRHILKAILQMAISVGSYTLSY